MSSDRTPSSAPATVPATAASSASPSEPVVLDAGGGLRAELLPHGGLQRLWAGECLVNAYIGNAIESGPANLWLRARGADGVLDDRDACQPLLGPAGPMHGAPSADGRGWRGVGVAHGPLAGLRITLEYRLASEASAWCWQLALEHAGTAPVTLDLLALQDLALAPYGAVRLNEFYVSQYLDHQARDAGATGWVLMTRQNQAAGGRFPWSLIGSAGRRAVGYATDGLQLRGVGPGGIAPHIELPSTRLQHEHAVAALQLEPLRLAPGERTVMAVWGLLVADHPAASDAQDLRRIDAVLALPLVQVPPAPWTADEAVRAATVPLHRRGFAVQAAQASLDGDALGDAELATWCPGPWRQPERAADGTFWSAFHGMADTPAHLVSRAKDEAAMRPHGHVLRSGRRPRPDEQAMTSTAWMAGVFHSMTTQGHVSINRLLSTQRSYLGWFDWQGLRLAVELGGRWRLLRRPSAWSVEPERCRWLYAAEGVRIEVAAEALDAPAAMRLSVRELGGQSLRWRVVAHLALDGDDGNQPGVLRAEARDAAWWLTPRPDSELGRRFPQGGLWLRAEPGSPPLDLGGDERLHGDGRSRHEPRLVVDVAASAGFGFRLEAAFVEDGPDRLQPATADRDALPAAPPVLRLLEGTPPEAAEAIGPWLEILPWYAHNALIHYLSPRGLEQYSGGGWGTRDVCQGPVEALLALGRVDAVRELLLRVMAAQAPAGDWPQWFMFFARDAHIRAGDAHGDVVYWPVLALAQYLLASGDAAILDATVPFHGDTDAPSLAEHLRRALDLIETRVVSGTRLAAYGHGDWNDSLQPADPAMREHLCSAWTVTLHYQTLVTLAEAMQRLGRSAEAEHWREAAAGVREDFRRLLLADGVLAGYAMFDGAQPHAAPTLMLHPRDQRTGVRYSALAMVHAIDNDLLTPEETRAHLALIAEHLTGPDGLRLFDRPMPYHGGPQRWFQRAESATFFGREIGLMYMHAHLRHAQALAHVGEAEAFWQALGLAHPIGLRERLPQATPRQANCYYSSSDAAFADRNQASGEYQRVALGTVALDGGWRVYSSGAGIALQLFVGRLLGWRVDGDAWLVDPVMPPRLDGLRLALSLGDAEWALHYEVGPRGCGVEAVTVDGQTIALVPGANPHRPGAVRLPKAVLAGPRRHQVTIRLG